MSAELIAEIERRCNVPVTLCDCGRCFEDLVELRPGMVLGFDVAAVDQDSETDTAAWISWTPPTRKFSGGGRIGGLVLGEGGGDLGPVAVRVEDESGRALAGAWFELWQDGLKLTAALTGARGRASAALPGGDYEIRVAAHGFHTRILERRIAGAERVGAHKTSMLQDVEAGKPLEVEGMLGVVVELAEMTGVEVPTLRALYACVSLLDRTIERHSLRIAGTPR